MAKNLGCYLDSKLSRESMTSNFLKKVNAKQQFLYWQNKSLIQNDIDYYAIPLYRHILIMPANCGTYYYYYYYYHHHHHHYYYYYYFNWDPLHARLNSHYKA